MKRSRWGALVLCVCLISSIFVGCNKTNNEDGGAGTDPKVSQEVQNDKGNKDAFLKLFPQDQEEHFYHGYSEFGYSLKFEKLEEKDGKTNIVYKGYMIDGEGDDPNDRTFNLIYELSDEGVVCKVDKAKEFGPYDSLHLMNSVVEEKQVLKLPLERGNKWEEEFIFRGKNYTAYSEITDIYKSKDGNVCYTVKTDIDGIEGFLDKTYHEVRTYEEGKGLINFENKLPLSIFSSENMGMTEEDYKFMYSLVEQN